MKDHSRNGSINSPGVSSCQNPTLSHLSAIHVSDDNVFFVRTSLHPTKTFLATRFDVPVPWQSYAHAILDESFVPESPFLPSSVCLRSKADPRIRKKGSKITTLKQYVMLPHEIVSSIYHYGRPELVFYHRLEAVCHAST